MLRCYSFVFLFRSSFFTNYLIKYQGRQPLGGSGGQDAIWSAGTAVVCYADEHIFWRKMLIRVSAFTSKLTTVFRSPWLPKKDVHFQNSNYVVRSFTTTQYCYSKQFQGGEKNKSTVYYVVALGVLVCGLSYAAVPLYRLFCQVKLYFS